MFGERPRVGLLTTTSLPESTLAKLETEEELENLLAQTNNTEDITAAEVDDSDKENVVSEDGVTENVDQYEEKFCKSVIVFLNWLSAMSANCANDRRPSSENEKNQ